MLKSTGILLPLTVLIPINMKPLKYGWCISDIPEVGLVTFDLLLELHIEHKKVSKTLTSITIYS